MNLILSGNAGILTAYGNEEGVRGRLILSPPNAPHFVSCDERSLYKRVYRLFTEELIVNAVSEWKTIAELFGEFGATLTLSEDEIAWYLDIISLIEKETNELPTKMLICYLLSALATRPEKKEVNTGERVPKYVLDSMTYIEDNLDKRISADSLAKTFHVGRTTLMTGFKKHADLSLGEYIDSRRILRATSLLKEGHTVESAALCCGFSDSGGLIRLFKRYHGTTPLKFVRKSKK